MIEYNEVTGIFVVRFWDVDKFENFEKANGIVTAHNLMRSGIKPLNEIISKNSISEYGLRWKVGQYMKDPVYAAKLGNMQLSAEAAPGAIQGSEKRIILSTGLGPGVLIMDATWGASEYNGYNILGINVFTYVDGTTGTAVADQYASTSIPGGFVKPPASMTITRYETTKNA